MPNVVRLTGSAIAALLLGGCAGTGNTVAPPSTRAAAFQTCPGFVVGGLPDRFASVERKLPDLGGNLHGRIERWSDGSASVTFYAGYDIFDELDDVDFAERAVTTTTRSYVLHETKIDPGLLALSWTEKGDAPLCRQIAVVARQLPEVALLSAADSTRVGNA